jgi:hypothetical protein
LGVARWKLDSTLITDYYFSSTPAFASRTYSGIGVAWGAGVQAHVKMFGVRLEYEGLDVDSNPASVVSLSVFLSL